MAKEQVEHLVAKLVTDIIQGSVLELVDVEYVKERDWYLRVFLDKPGGVEVEDCQGVSEQLEDKLDQLDPIKESYYLEVSSPGLDRPLKKERDFVRHKGDKVEVHTFLPIEGKKMLVGILLGLSEDGKIQLSIDGTHVDISRDKASLTRLHLEF